MFKKWCSVIILVVSLMIVGVGIPAVAQDVCVTDYMANLALPTTVTELRQYIKDLREVLSECDPVSEEVIEVEPKANLQDDDFGEDEENGCLYGILIGSRESSPEIFGMAGGETRLNMLFEMKKPGQSKFEEARFDKHMSDQIDDINIHLWDGPFRKGRYEVRYEAFIGAEPVTLAFDVEHNAEYRVAVLCGL